MNADRGLSWAVLRRVLDLSVLVLLAFVLRLYHLDRVDLRGDEAFDLLYASQALGEIIRNDLCCQMYPPLFHTALHFWQKAARDSAFAFRFLFGLVPGVLAVPLTYRLAGETGQEGNGHKGLRYLRIGGGSEVPVVAALLATANPYLVWWSQDGHFYSAVVAAAAAIMWLGMRCLNRSAPRRSLLGYGLASGLGLYLHYFVAFPWAALNLLALMARWRREISAATFKRWLLTQIGVLALFAPWLYLALYLMQRFELGWASSVSLGEMLWRLFRAYSLGPATWPELSAVLVGFGAVLALGLPAYMLRVDGRQVWQFLFLLLVPLAAFWLLSLLRPMFDEKFTVFVLPLYLSLLAMAVVGFRRWRGASVGALLLLLVGCGLPLHRHYWDVTTYKSPAWGQAMAFVHSRAQPGDVLIYSFPDPAVLYYNRDRLPVKLLPARGGLAAAEVEAEVAELAGDEDRIWLIPIPQPHWDAEGAVERWLERHAAALEREGFRGIWVRLFASQRALEPRLQPVDATFGDRLRLLGSVLEAHRTEEGEVAEVNLILLWQCLAPTDWPYKVFAHLVGPEEAILGQQDNEPVWGTYPTTSWSPGETVVDQYSIRPKERVLPGGWELRVGFYDPESGARLPATGNDTCEDYAVLPFP